MLTRSQARVAQSTPERVHAVQCCALGVEAKHGHPQCVCTLLRDRTYATRNKDQGLSTVRQRDRRCPLHEFDVEVPPAIINPRQIPSAVQIASSTRVARRDHGLGRTEIDHPLTAQLDGLNVVRTPRHWFRMQDLHGSRVHPTAEITAITVGPES